MGTSFGNPERLMCGASDSVRAQFPNTNVFGSGAAYVRRERSSPHLLFVLAAHSPPLLPQPRLMQLLGLGGIAIQERHDHRPAGPATIQEHSAPTLGTSGPPVPGGPQRPLGLDDPGQIERLVRPAARAVQPALAAMRDLRREEIPGVLGPQRKDAADHPGHRSPSKNELRTRPCGCCRYRWASGSQVGKVQERTHPAAGVPERGRWSRQMRVERRQCSRQR